MEYNHNILRVFEVRAKPGQKEALFSKLSSTSITVVQGKPGNLGYFFGESLSSDGNDLTFVSIWSNMESIQSVFGDEWESSHLPEGYSEIIESCSIRHIRFSGHTTAV